VISLFPVIGPVPITCRRFLLSLYGRKSQICRWNFSKVFHSFGDKVFPVSAAISGCHSLFGNRLGTFTSSLQWSKTASLPVEFWWYLSHFRRYKYFRFWWSHYYFWLSLNVVFTCEHFLWVCRDRRLCFFAARITIRLQVRRHSALSRYERKTSPVSK